MNALLERLIFKLTSARFILALFAGFVFTYCAIYTIIPVDQSMQIITLVFALYFAQRRKE